MTSHALDPRHKQSHLGPPSNVTYFMDGPNCNCIVPFNKTVQRWFCAWQC